MKYLILFPLLASLNVGWARDTKSVQAAEPLSEERINSVLNDAYKKFKDLKKGANADYIPALKSVNSELFGIVLVTPDGRVFEKGDTAHKFSIQSISKVFTMAEVMEEKGTKAIEDSVGVLATGDVFNSIMAIEKNKGHKMNAFVNPGAIATTSMVSGKTADEVWKKIITVQSEFAGRQLEVDQQVYKSESETNQRNQAIGMLMHAYDIIKDKPQQATDLYTRQCSIAVNAKDLAVMSATLANGGFNPVTKQQVVEQKYVKNILAVMSTAGLYDNAGEWLFTTGLPAKSGVGGGIIAVSPGKFGIATFSPRLDEAGNSVRGQEAIAYITEKLNANPYDVQPVGQRIKQAEEVKVEE